jgi:predicted phage terminase large subunit-like protein
VIKELDINTAIKYKYWNDVEDSREDLFKFTGTTFRKFKPKGFHKKFYDILTMFAEGKIKNLITSMPPQHGKSEGATRRLMAFIAGFRPDARMALICYAATKSEKFGREIISIMREREYKDIFPEVNYPERGYTGAKSNTNNLRESISSEGSMKFIGVDGALTGDPIDILNMDDLYKNWIEGNSPVTQEKVWEFYLAVADTRLHNDSQQLITFTRWSNNDLIAKLDEKGFVVSYDGTKDLDELLYSMRSDQFLMINFEALKTSTETKLDPRKVGDALWEERHSKFKLNSARSKDVNMFECLYQGNPMSRDGLLYQGKWQTYKSIPENVTKKGNYTDTADAGADYLCSICYDRVGDIIYVTDILYTLDGMESTELMMPRMLNDAGTRIANVESNNGGRYFAINIQKQTKCVISWFHQSLNKEARIISNSAQVQRHIYFPEGWETRWEVFWKHLTGFKKNFRSNAQDGAPDVLTGIIEKNIVFKNPTQPNYETEHTRFIKGDSTGFNASPWNADRKSTSGDFF